MNLPNNKFSIKNKVQFPINFNENETHKIYLIKKTHYKMLGIQNKNLKA